MVKHGKKQRVVRLMTVTRSSTPPVPRRRRPASRPASASRSCPASRRSSAVPAYAGIPLTTKNHKEVAVVTCGDKVDWRQYADDRTLVLLSGVGTIGRDRRRAGRGRPLAARPRSR